MKKIIQTFLPFIISSQLFAIVGFGAYGDFDLLKYPDGTSGDLETSGVEYGGFNNATGFGLLFYIDAFPFVDLETDIEFVGNVYKYTPYVGGQPLSSKGEMPWGRVSTYLTARKEILGLSIPLLAKSVSRVTPEMSILLLLISRVLNILTLKSYFFQVT